MSRKKCKCPPAGAPEWVMTFGDMMSLLLTFFIMIVSMSEIKKEDEFLAVVDAIQKAFGMHGGGARMPTTEPPEQSMRERLDRLQLAREPNRSHTIEEGTEGRHDTVTLVREGDRYIVGSRITFDPGSAELTEESIPLLTQIARQVKGLKNKLEIRGHAATSEERVDSPYPDLHALSFARARAVARFLTSPEVGIDIDRIRLIAVGDAEPVRVRVYSDSALEPNRRVEVVQMEAVTDDFRQPESDGAR